MDDTNQGPCAAHASRNIGQEIRDSDGKISAWATNSWVAEVIERELFENELLPFYRRGELK
jgi:hypothetical protein